MPSCDLTTRSDELAARAIALRAELGYNCAQAVACTLAPEIGADAEACYVLSEGFGGGMGGHTETCGAISDELREQCYAQAEQYYTEQVEIGLKAIHDTLGK